jgi:hypothetical protein
MQQHLVGNGSSAAVVLLKGAKFINTPQSDYYLASTHKGGSTSLMRCAYAAQAVSQISVFSG